MALLSLKDAKEQDFSELGINLKSQKRKRAYGLER